jgi:hypothetical protein
MSDDTNEDRRPVEAPVPPSALHREAMRVERDRIEAAEQQEGDR